MASAPVASAASSTRSERRYESADIVPPTFTAAFALRTCWASRSASEKTATHSTPSRCAVFITRSAISPRLAIRIRLNITALRFPLLLLGRRWRLPPGRGAAPLGPRSGPPCPRSGPPRPGSGPKAVRPELGRLSAKRRRQSANAAVQGASPARTRPAAHGASARAHCVPARDAPCRPPGPSTGWPTLRCHHSLAGCRPTHPTPLLLHGSSPCCSQRGGAVLFCPAGGAATKVIVQIAHAARTIERRRFALPFDMIDEMNQTHLRHAHPNVLDSCSCS
mmetsp:Transcript_36537/g.96057  ORF Transcript_36537/g.96057 Transcript_36537/m.96057 type:complete len:278 (-) Transcript_36537:293-1126(-)